MLIIAANQFEFDLPDSKETLLLAAAGRHEFESVDQFVKACANCSVNTLQSTDPVSCATLATAVPLHYIERFLGWQPPRDAATYRIQTDWNDIELVFVFGSTFLWYHWTTSA